MKSFDLLSQKFNASSNIEAFREMQDFILLWMIFEKDVLGIKNESRRGDRATATLKNVSQELQNLSHFLSVKLVDASLLKSVYDKQKELYVNPSDPSRNFKGFYLNADQKELMTKAFVDNNATDEEKFEAVLTIIFKYRCNFIHGDKELQNLHIRQQDRFRLYCDLLIECINAKETIKHENTIGKAY